MKKLCFNWMTWGMLSEFEAKKIYDMVGEK